MLPIHATDKRREMAVKIARLLRACIIGLSLAAAMTPLVVIPLARVFEGERPTIHSLIGSVIAVAGVIGLVLTK